MISHEAHKIGVVIEHAFRSLLEKADVALGGLAVIYDKNAMEASGYAAVMADVMKEHVHLVEFYDNEADPSVKWVDRVMYVRDINGGTSLLLRCLFCFRVALDSRVLSLRDAKALESISALLAHAGPQ